MWAWHDVKHVHVLSSVCNIGTTQTQIRSAENPTGFRKISKPISQVDYSQNMGGADRFGQLASCYKFSHLSYKWYQVIYHFCVEAALVKRMHFSKECQI